MELTTTTTAVEEIVFLEEEENTLANRYLLFSLGKETYGLEIRYVTEIVVMQHITEVPDMPGFIRGVINLRGNVISVMDMRSRFHLEQRDYDGRTCIVVVQVNNLSIGLIVDTVKEVQDIPEGMIDPAPRTHSGLKSSYISGLGKNGGQVKILLNVEKILYDEELQQAVQLS